MVRFASLLLSGVMVFGAIAGCEKKTDSPGDAGPAPKGAKLQDFSERNDAPPPPPPRKRG
jgi:hypothetical protein